MTRYQWRCGLLFLTVLFGAQYLAAAIGTWLGGPTP